MNADVSVAGYLIAHPDLYGQFLHRMDIPFGKKIVKSVFGICSRLWMKYSAFPSLPELLEIIANHPKIKDDLKEIYVDTAKEIYSPKSWSDATREVILSRIIEQYKVGLAEEISNVTLLNVTDKAMSISQQIDKLDYLLGGDRDDWIFPLANDVLDDPTLFLEKMLGPRITTGISTWDNMMAGGPCLGESMMIIGHTNHGKSAICYSMAIDQVRAGFRSVIYSLDSPKNDIYAKTWANISGVGIEDDKIRSEFNHRLKSSIQESWRTKLIFRWWPRHMKSTEDIRRDLLACQKHCRKIDLDAGVDPSEAGKIHAVYIDDGSCVKSKEKISENWLRASHTYGELDGIGKEINAFMCVSSQAKLETSAEHVDMKVVTEAKGKNHPMTHVVGWCRSDLELKEGTGRLYIDKAKRTKCHYYVPVKLNKNLMRLTENGEPFYPNVQAEIESQPRDYNPRKRGKPMDAKLMREQFMRGGNDAEDIRPIRKKWIKNEDDFGNDDDYGGNMFRKRVRLR